MPDFPGARWWKFDFHTHTPASDDYGKGSQQDTLKQISPEDWLLGFMRAGVDCVAVTDHNSGAWIDRLKQALVHLEDHADHRSLRLFPGVEIAANGGVHILGVFGPAASGDTITGLLSVIKFPDDKIGTSAAVSPLSPQDVVQAIAEKGGLPILAHADGPHGAFQVLQGVSLQQLMKARELAAVELCDPSVPKPSCLNDALPIAEVLGSDAHHPDAATGPKHPGSHYTWVKMGTPSFEGLRLALLDGSPLSVQRSDQGDVGPNRHAEAWIEALEIADAQVCGRGTPLELSFNPWLNAIIGGRGTGKSTLVEFLRIALRRDKELSGKLAADFGEFARIPAKRNDSGALTDKTTVRVFYRKDGERYRLQWDQRGSLIPIEHEQAPDGWVAEPGAITQRFPVRIFSQKQVFSLSEDQSGLRLIVDETPAVNHQKWDAQWHELETQFLTLRAKARELTEKLKSVPRLQGELTDLKHKLAVFEGAEHADMLKRYQRRQRQRRELDHVAEDLDQIRQVLERAGEACALGAYDDALFDENDKADREILTELAKVTTAVSEARNDISSTGKKIAAMSNGWNKALKASHWAKELGTATEAYQQWVARLQQQGVSDPSQFGQLVQRRQIVEQELKNLERLDDSIRAAIQQAEEVLDKLAGLRRDLASRRADFLTRTLHDNRFVRIEVRPYQDSLPQVELAFRSLIERPDERLQDDILSADGNKGVLADLYRELPQDTEAARVKIEQRLRELKKNLVAVARGKEVAGFSGWFGNHLRRLKPETLDRIETWYPEDGLTAEYSVRGDGQDFRPIQQGSPGQRTAAMLAFLLAYGSEPIVLDQPEDDLDNHLIYDLIVRQIRENKPRRQLIVVTHNPNIVVNGDAEFVVAMDVCAGQCKVVERGCLQDQEIRGKICRVMEGGEHAFRQRYRRLVKEMEHV